MEEQAREYCAFIDESGGAGLDFSKSGTSTHFIVCAVLVEATKVKLLQDAAEVLAKRYFQGSEIKSSSVGKKIPRRKQILDDIAKMDCHVYALVVHKRILADMSKGYKYHQTFFKNLHGKIERELLRTFPYITLSVDEHGDREFMDSFQRYIVRKYGSIFFPDQTIRFCDSRTERLIQVADFLAGTLAINYEESKKAPEHKELLQCIPRMAIHHYPYVPLDTSRFGSDSMYATNIDIVSGISFRTAVAFLKELEGSSDNDKLTQMACLEYILNEFCYGDPERYITAPEIAAWLNNSRDNSDITQDIVIDAMGKMRNEGVLISSSSDGYKLPYSEEDLIRFVEYMNAKIMPMINKVKICRDRVNTATGYKLDVLGKTEFHELKDIIDNLRNR